MSITKTNADDQIEIVGDFKHVQIRTASIIKEDNVEIHRAFSRRILTPGDLDKDNKLVDTDLSKESAEVRGVCNTVSTADVKESWRKELVANLPKGFTP